MVSAKSSCRDITANRSQALPLLFYFVGARGEPGNEASHRQGGRSSEVVAKRGSTVNKNTSGSLYIIKQHGVCLH